MVLPERTLRLPGPILRWKLAKREHSQQEFLAGNNECWWEGELLFALRCEHCETAGGVRWCPLGAARHASLLCFGRDGRVMACIKHGWCLVRAVRTQDCKGVNRRTSSRAEVPIVLFLNFF